VVPATAFTAFTAFNPFISLVCNLKESIIMFSIDIGIKVGAGVRSRWKLFVYVGVFVVLLNGAGIWAVKSQSTQVVKPSTMEFEVEGIQVHLVNKAKYSDKLINQVEDAIKKSVPDILTVTNGHLIPKKEIEITLAKSEENAEINLPPYVTSTIYNPDEIYLDEFNFNEMLIYAMFNEKDTISPFQTIGLAEHLLADKADGEYYSAHEMWMIHARYNYPSSLEDLVQGQVYKRRILLSIKRDGHGPYSNTSYWKVASFANYLMEQYGLEKFLPLYKSSDIVKDLERTYGKSFADLESEWTGFVKELEDELPEKYNRQLEEDYQYWYEG
jgi:hypothetical protein